MLKLSQTLWCLVIVESLGVMVVIKDAQQHVKVED